MLKCIARQEQKGSGLNNLAIHFGLEVLEPSLEIPTDMSTPCHLQLLDNYFLDLSLHLDLYQLDTWITTSWLHLTFRQYGLSITNIHPDQINLLEHPAEQLLMVPISFIRCT